MYENQKHAPSEARAWEILKVIARGLPEAEEAAPVFLASYWLLDQRFLTANDGRLLTFQEPHHAAAAVGRLQAYKFPDVFVWPAWRAAIKDIAPEAGVWAFDAVPSMAGEDASAQVAALVDGIVRYLGTTVGPELERLADELGVEP